MSRRSRIRTRRVPRAGSTNTMGLAIARTRPLSAADVARQRGIVELALSEFCKARHCDLHWRSLADTLAVARVLAEQGIGAGRDAEDLMDNATVALYDVQRRAQARGTWTLYADEIEALHWLVRLHVTVQLPACTYGHFETALQTANRRAHQARHGNASPGAVVLQGQIGERQELPR